MQAQLSATAASALIHRIESDPSDHLFANGGMAKPRSKKSTDSYRKWLVEETLLGAIVSLKPEDGAEAVPIGTVSLEQQWTPHHRTAVMGISIGNEFRGKGYGGEAIIWAVEWGFKAVGLHRIEIGHFSWNEGAGRLYQRLGFKEEGRRKECFWFNGGK
jgi:RimJ/RimL family protein N-acetyltransferase